jgi:hypothetical protein
MEFLIERPSHREHCRIVEKTAPEAAAMPNRHSFKLNRTGFLLAVVSAAFAGHANAAAGRVDFAIGGATVSGTDGRARPLTKGADLDSGDTIKTNDGRAQIRFTDGSYVSLQPNTDFSIKEYSYDGKTDGSERGFFGLAKGAMRAVTGLIGRVNRNRYQITTPTATVGIRGTGGLIQVQNDGSTLIVGTSGIWTLTNSAGSLDIPAGTSGLAPTTPNQPPRQADKGPDVPPPPPPVQTIFTQGDQRTSDGTAAIGVVPLVSGSGYAATIAFTSSFLASPTTNGNVTAIFNPAGQMTSATFSNGSNFVLDPTTGAHAEFGTDGILAWGRWTGDVSGKANFDGVIPFSDTYSQNQGLHYVVGMPTPTMPVTGTATYAMMGATSPTFVDGHAAPGTFSGGLSVNFGTQMITMGLLVNMPSAGVGYAIAGNTSYAGSSFNGSASFSGGVPSSPLAIVGTTSTSCSCFCNASVQGFFAGATAERVGLGYQIQDTTGTVIGAAAFKKTP